MPKALVLPGLDKLGLVLQFSFGELGIDPEMLTEELVGERDVTRHVKVVMPGDNLDGQCLRGTASDKRYQRKCRFAERPMTVEESEFWSHMDGDVPFEYQDPMLIAIARQVADLRWNRRRAMADKPYRPKPRRFRLGPCLNHRVPRDASKGVIVRNAAGETVADIGRN